MMDAASAVPSPECNPGAQEWNVGELSAAVQLQDRPRPRTAPKAISSWCTSPQKRVFDVICTLAILPLVFPLILVIGLTIKLTSRGPTIFRQVRVGRGGRHFSLLKFRSMVDGCSGPGLTCKGDSRVTPAGRVLRKYKLDELPQLFNVLRGDMSLVGPRPHSPELFVLDAADQTILLLRPGITGSASLQFRREEELLLEMCWNDLRRYYISTILPVKMRLELDYAAHATLFADLKLLLQTVTAIFRPRLDKSPNAQPALSSDRQAA